MDLTEGSEALIRYAAELARPFEARIDVLYVWEPPRYLSPETMIAIPGWNAAELQDAISDESRKSLEKMVQSVGLKDLKVTVGVEVGNVAASILRVAQAEPQTLIVMGTHGRSALARMLIGSVASRS